MSCKRIRDTKIFSHLYFIELTLIKMLFCVYRTDRTFNITIHVTYLTFRVI